MSSAKWSALTTLTSGISGADFNSGVNYLGSEIDNSAAGGRYRYLAIELTYNADSTFPTADQTIEVYLIASLDGSAYEDGDASPIDPKIAPIAVFAMRSVDINIQSAWHIPIPPCKFKILVKSEVTGDGVVTVDAYGYNEEAV